MGIFSDIGSLIMTPLYYVISAVLLAWHWFFTQIGLDPEGGASWALSIIGLTLVIRMALIPLFVKQIKSSRNMQLIQPKVKELQKKYGHDRERLAQETMKLYKETGTNPFASCLPLLLQMPIFFALFRLLDQAAKKGTAHGLLTEDLARKFGESEIFGTFPLSQSFWQARIWGPTPDGAVMVLALILVLAMTATTFTTQRQLMRKNMPADALSGPYAQQQKLLLYVLPVAFGLGGVAFPIGVLLYWTTSNLWTMGQQFYVIRNNPAPGTPAAQAKVDRDRAKAERKGTLVVEAPPEVEEAPRPAVRQQPKKQTRDQRRQGGTRPPGGAQAKPKPSGAPPKPGQKSAPPKSSQKKPSKGEKS
ncbi:membrane protein insertase YidC [Nocardioides sp. W7]|uniref:membrane protein insertase YidC n=1 Tax=Nocardioides sp. W7 TaxID=2931390 RepID=UPI00246876FD|nr:membrane protein insertase YidC [Nocardioides sp. W7]